METFGMDSSGWPVAPGSGSSSHFARHGLSRRGFIGGAAAAAAGASLGQRAAVACRRIGRIVLHPAAPADARDNDRQRGRFPLRLLRARVDPSSITDFKGFVGVADVRGTGTARNPDGSVETLLFDTDMRFMQGTYIGLDGAVHEATFGFV